MPSPISISDEAKCILSDLPYSFPSRDAKNLPFVRATTKAYVKPQVDRTLEVYGTSVSYKLIAGVNCMVIRPKKLQVGWKIFYIFK